MLERPGQDWDNHLADYVVVTHTAKDVKVTVKKGAGCLVLVIVAALIVAILGGNHEVA